MKLTVFFGPQVSTHGYSQNQILVWKYPSLVQVAKLTGHSYRVLYLAMSPDGEAIVTGAGDETLRFWNVFSKARSQKDCAKFLSDFDSNLHKWWFSSPPQAQIDTVEVCQGT